jgi:hypothetical protein
MALEAANVNVAVTGGVYFAPVATALPADATTALAVGYLEVGYLTEDGITQSVGGASTDIKAWQNSDIVRTLQTEHTLTYALTLLETNPNALELYSGGNYAAGIVEIRAGVLPHQVYVVDVIDGADHIRIVIPDGQISERGDIVYANASAISYPITITCFPDDTGVKAYVHYATAGVPAA